MKTRHLISLAGILGALWLAPLSCAAQSSLDAATRGQTIDALALQLSEHYVFPREAAALATMLRTRQQRGDYDQLDDADAFAKALTAHLREAGGVSTLRVRVAPGAGGAKAAAPSRQGVVKTELMAGNIGYLQLDHFIRASEAWPGIMSAMSELAGSAALIVDLRDNSGGDAYSAAFLGAYLFDKRTHLYDVYWREGDTLQQFFTAKNIVGKSYGQKKPVFVLVGAGTVSTAEAFSHSLRQRKRATLVGAVTAGTASVGRGHGLNRQFEAVIPVGRSIDPVTKTNWEGAGVRPDVLVPADQALARAHELALKAIAREE